MKVFEVRGVRRQSPGASKEYPFGRHSPGASKDSHFGRFGARKVQNYGATLPQVQCRQVWIAELVWRLLLAGRVGQSCFGVLVPAASFDGRFVLPVVP